MLTDWTGWLVRSGRCSSVFGLMWIGYVHGSSTCLYAVRWRAPALIFHWSLPRRRCLYPPVGNVYCYARTDLPRRRLRSPGGPSRAAAVRTPDDRRALFAYPCCFIDGWWINPVYSACAAFLVLILVTVFVLMLFQFSNHPSTTFRQLLHILRIMLCEEYVPVYVL